MIDKKMVLIFITGAGVGFTAKTLIPSNKTKTHTEQIVNNVTTTQIASSQAKTEKQAEMSKDVVHEVRIEKEFDEVGRIRKEITLNIDRGKISQVHNDVTSHQLVDTTQHSKTDEKLIQVKEVSQNEQNWSISALYPLSLSSYQNGFLWTDMSLQMSRKIFFGLSLVAQSDLRFQKPMIGVQLNF